MGDVGALEASKSKELIAKWLLISRLPGNGIPLIVYSRPGFSTNKLIEWSFKEVIESIRKWYREGGRVTDPYTKVLNYVENFEGVDLHEVLKFDRVINLINEVRSVNAPVILTVTPSFLLKRGLRELVSAIESSVFPLLHVYNFLDLDERTLTELYELILQGDLELNVPVVFSQQLVPGISRRSMSMSMIGGMVIHSLLPKVDEWESYVNFKYGDKHDKPSIEFLKLFSPSYKIGEPFKFTLININKENFGVEDPFIAEELQVYEKEGKLIEAPPSLGFGNEVIPLPDVWERVITLPWNLEEIASEIALKLLGSYPLVNALKRTRRRSSHISFIMNGLYQGSFASKAQAVRTLISFVKRELINSYEDVAIANALLIRALDVLYDYAEKYEGFGNCGEPCEALKLYCEIFEELGNVEGLEAVMNELEEVIVELTGMGVEKACKAF